MTPSLTQSTSIQKPARRRLALWLGAILAVLLVGGVLGWRWLGKHVFTPNLEQALGRDDPGPQYDRPSIIDYTAVKKWVGLGADANAEGGASMTALKVAVDRRDREFVRYLISHGARLEVRSGPAGNDSPLKSACGSFGKKADHTLVRQLLDAGANPVGPVGSTPYNTALIIAVRSLDVDLMALLLNAGAGKEQKSLDLALLYAVQPKPLSRDRKRQLEMLELLLTRGADPNALSPQNYSTLQESVRAAQVDVVRVLLAYGADAKRKCPDGTGILKLARDRKRLLPQQMKAIVGLLKAAGAKE